MESFDWAELVSLILQFLAAMGIEFMSIFEF